MSSGLVNLSRTLIVQAYQPVDLGMSSGLVNLSRAPYDVSTLRSSLCEGGEGFYISNIELLDKKGKWLGIALRANNPIHISNNLKTIESYKGRASFGLLRNNAIINKLTAISILFF
ncbi:hypothetical protein PoB_000975900 [Plakobranchus ocellatus]|uniref:SH3 domain-containing protein n=1 Tax=Plakobranchus ocellatus TaxID=259542 RepID=A0AAV3YMB6_9GAST|nr:hypothetical protein PoB_000975900 [Plakobranchus ocellatus]